MHAANGSDNDVKYKPAAGLSGDEMLLLARDQDKN